MELYEPVEVDVDVVVDVDVEANDCGLSEVSAHLINKKVGIQESAKSLRKVSHP